MNVSKRNECGRLGFTEEERQKKLPSRGPVELYTECPQSVLYL
jgi:hypothetical protein